MKIIALSKRGNAKLKKFVEDQDAAGAGIEVCKKYRERFKCSFKELRILSVLWLHVEERVASRFAA